MPLPLPQPPPPPSPSSLTSEPSKEKVVVWIGQGGQHVLDIFTKLQGETAG